MSISVPMPLNEVADKYTIAKLKYERLPDENLEALSQQIQYYAAGLDFADTALGNLVGRLYEINGHMWDAEHAIRLGQDQSLGLEEIGRRALHIRDLNLTRMQIKNLIAEHTGSGFQEVKMNYATPGAQQTA